MELAIMVSRSNAGTYDIVGENEDWERVREAVESVEERGDLVGWSHWTKVYDCTTAHGDLVVYFVGVVEDANLCRVCEVHGILTVVEDDAATLCQSCTEQSRCSMAWEQDALKDAEYLYSVANGSGRGDGADATAYTLGPVGRGYAPGGTTHIVRYHYVSDGVNGYAWADSPEDAMAGLHGLPDWWEGDEDN